LPADAGSIGTFAGVGSVVVAVIVLVVFSAGRPQPKPANRIRRKAKCFIVSAVKLKTVRIFAKKVKIANCSLPKAAGKTVGFEP